MTLLRKSCLEIARSLVTKSEIFLRNILQLSFIAQKHCLWHQPGKTHPTSSLRWDRINNFTGNKRSIFYSQYFSDEWSIAHAEDTFKPSGFLLVNKVNPRDQLELIAKPYGDLFLPFFYSWSLIPINENSPVLNMTTPLLTSMSSCVQNIKICLEIKHIRVLENVEPGWIQKCIESVKGEYTIRYDTIQ